MNCFLPFAVEYENSIENMYGSSKEMLGEHYLSFAYDSGGWLFVISLKKADYGKVYFFRTDHSIEDGRTLLANSFDEFIDGLHARE